MPVVVNDLGAVTINIGVKPRPVRVATLADAPPSTPGRADPRWVWLTGSPGPLGWKESTLSPPPPGVFEVRWCDPLTKAEFDSATLAGTDGKPLAPGDRAGAVWLDAVNPGWEALSRAALDVVGDVPQEQRGELAAALRTPLATPGDHWRSALLLRALAPSTPAAADFQPAALNTLARQQGDMWAGAIGKLCRADAALGLQVARRLVQIGYLPTSDSGGSWGVLWSEADPAFLDALITSTPQGAVTAATSFIAGQPSALAWVRDDAGLRDPIAGASLATVGVVSLLDQRTVGTLSLAGGVGQRTQGEPVPFRPFIGQLMSAAPAQRQSGAGVLATVNLGPAVLTLPVGTTPVPAIPPGVLIGPFFRDWTLASFRRQQPVQVGGIAGSLVMTGGAVPAWTVYLECRTETGSTSAVESERLRIWAGPSGTPVVAIEIAPDGSVARCTGAAQLPPPAFAVSRIPGGWCATVTLPVSAVDAGGILRLGVEHIAESGLRSTWPRPMLPWQTEPGRLAIDAAAWDRELKP